MTEFRGPQWPSGPTLPSYRWGWKERAQGVSLGKRQEWETGLWHLTHCLTCDNDTHWRALRTTKVLHKYKGTLLLLTFLLFKLNFRSSERELFFSCTDLKLYFPDLSLTVDVNSKHSKRRVPEVETRTCSGTGPCGKYFGVLFSGPELGLWELLFLTPQRFPLLLYLKCSL